MSAAFQSKQNALCRFGEDGLTVTYVYLLTSIFTRSNILSGRDLLYVGMTSDLKRRLAEHNAGWDTT